MAKTSSKQTIATDVRLNIRNASPYVRDGHAELPWSAVAAATGGLSPDQELEVEFDGRVFPAQLDAVDGASSSPVVVFVLTSVPGGDEHYNARQSAILRPRTPDRNGTWPGAGPRENGVYLANKHLDVWFNLSAAGGNMDRKWFRGAATTVQVGRFEFLDTDAANHHPFEGHDPEKRAMQIDRVRIWRPPWDDHEPPYCDYPLFDRPWTHVNSGGGPVRAWTTFRSEPFSFSFRDLTTARRYQYTCRLHRTISLFADANYLIEDLRVHATPEGFDGASDLAFSVGYFMSCHLSLRPKVIHYPDIPDWFSVGCGMDMPRWPAYGFATDAHVTAVQNPAAGFGGSEQHEHKAFGWETAAARRIRSLHLFRLDARPVEVADEIGKLWYENLLKPLRAEVADGTGGGSA